MRIANSILEGHTSLPSVRRKMLASSNAKRARRPRISGLSKSRTSRLSAAIRIVSLATIGVGKLTQSVISSSCLRGMRGVLSIPWANSQIRRPRPELSLHWADPLAGYVSQPGHAKALQPNSDLNRYRQNIDGMPRQEGL